MAKFSFHCSNTRSAAASYGTEASYNSTAVSSPKSTAVGWLSRHEVNIRLDARQVSALSVMVENSFCSSNASAKFWFQKGTIKVDLKATVISLSSTADCLTTKTTGVCVHMPSVPSTKRIPENNAICAATPIVYIPNPLISKKKWTDIYRPLFLKILTI